MKTLFKTAVCLSVLLLVSSCVLDQIDSQPAAEPRLNCDALDSYTVQALKPQDISFSVSSNVPWSVTGFENADWITVSPASSAVSSLSEDILIKSVANPGFSDRSVSLTIQCGDGAVSRTVSIKQLRQGMLSVTPIAETDLFAKDGGSKTFSIESNMDWEASAADEWLNLSPAKGSAEGSAQIFSVTATAAANTSIARSTVVTVISGESTFAFTVNQEGAQLEFVDVENPVVDRTGGELILKVDAGMEWKVEADNPAFAVSKVGNDQVKVSAPWNNQFAVRKTTVTIKPVSDAYGDVSRSVEVTQDINFTFSGSCEVLDDGSVKLFGDAASKVSTIDKFRYASMVLKFGDKNFGASGQIWGTVSAQGCNIYSQISLGGNIRIRQDGNLVNTKKPGGEDVSTYKNVSIEGIDKAALNAMTEYRFEVVNEITDDPDYAGVKWHKVNFWYNGALKTTLNFRSIFEDDPTAEGSYWFGFEKASNDGTWYIVKSCDVTPYAE